MRLKYAPANIVEAARSALRRNDLSTAKRLIQSFQGENGTTPEALEALSWFPRGLCLSIDPVQQRVQVDDRPIRISRIRIRAPQVPGTTPGNIVTNHQLVREV